MTVPVIPVSELSSLLRRCLEGNFPLQWVSGEVSNLTRAASGHWYFSLKDDRAQLRCVMFRPRAQLVPWQLSNGQQVEVNARPTIYEPRGDVQLTVETVRRAGLGRLYEAFARLRLQLEAEGLFDNVRKRMLPRYPRRIGLITSSNTAACHDVLASLKRRAPHLPVVIYPTLVQGERAGPAIVAALRTANIARQCDVLLLVRGGGSLEDLWPFNEESVGRAIAASELPVITGIGHETDISIADLVADQRGATPTAAAELASATWFSARAEMQQLHQRLRAYWMHKLQTVYQHLDTVTARLAHPATRMNMHREKLLWLASRLRPSMHRRIENARQRLAHAAMRLHAGRPKTLRQHEEIGRCMERMDGAMRITFERWHSRLTQLDRALIHLGPQRTLERGYAIVRARSGVLVTRTVQLCPGDDFDVEFASGHIRARRLPSLPAAEPIAGDCNPD